MEDAIRKAFIDLMDGVKEHEIHEMTGLPEDRCKEIYNLYKIATCGAKK